MVNNIKNKIYSIIFLIISISLLFYTYYKSEIVWLGVRHNIYIQYYILSFILIIISSVTFILKKDTNQKIYLILSSIIIIFYLLETFLLSYEFYNKLNLDKNFQINNKIVDIDKRSKFEVYEEEKSKENLSLVFNHKSYFDENSKLYILGGKSKTKHLYCNESGYYSFFNSDRFGFRNDDRYWDKKELDLVFVGDSFGLNACVNKSNTVVEKILNINSEIKLLNLSWDGNGPISNYAIFKEYMRNKKSKRLIWFFYPNDFENLDYEKNNKILIKYINKNNFSQNLKQKQNQIDYIIENLINKNFSEKIQNKNKNFKLVNFIKLQKLRSIITYKGEPKYDLNLLKTVLKKTKNYAENNNIKTTFIYLPDFWEIKKNKQRKKKKILFTILEDLELDYLDFFDYIYEIENPISIFPFESYGHYNEKGYDLLANFIYERVYQK